MRNRRSTRVVLTLVALAVLIGAGPGSAQQSTPPDAATMQGMYERGIDFDAFRTSTMRRKQMWADNWAKSDPGHDFLSRARALDGNYRILAVAVDSCSDSVNTIPYIARLVERVGQLEMQIVHPEVGRLLLETYRTPDDRGATPTLVILDEDFEIVGVWVERPSPLQDWWVGHPEISDREKATRKQGWYDWDEGYTTYLEIIELLEAADARRREPSDRR